MDCCYGSSNLTKYKTLTQHCHRSAVQSQKAVSAYFTRKQHGLLALLQSLFKLCSEWQVISGEPDTVKWMDIFITLSLIPLFRAASNRQQKSARSFLARGTIRENQKKCRGNFYLVSTIDCLIIGLIMVHHL